MDAPFIPGEEQSLLDVLEDKDEEKPDDSLINESLRQDIEKSLSLLTDREAGVISYYFGLGGNAILTLEEIGEKFDLTRERVRQIKEKALARLQHAHRSKRLRSFLTR